MTLNDLGALVTIVAIVLFVLWVVGWASVATINEAERKLGREVRWQEMVFVLLCAVLVHGGLGLVAIAYVWLIMPEPEAKP